MGYWDPPPLPGPHSSQICTYLKILQHESVKNANLTTYIPTIGPQLNKAMFRCNVITKEIGYILYDIYFMEEKVFKKVSEYMYDQEISLKIHTLVYVPYLLNDNQTMLQHVFIHYQLPLNSCTNI